MTIKKYLFRRWTGESQVVLGCGLGPTTARLIGSRDHNGPRTGSFLGVDLHPR